LARERYLISTRRLSVTTYSFVLFFVVNSGSETRGRDFFASPLANPMVVVSKHESRNLLGRLVTSAAPGRT
jgi:hypothetical protein